MTTILNKEVFVLKLCLSLIITTFLFFMEESLVISVNEVLLKSLSKKEM